MRLGKVTRSWAACPERHEVGEPVGGFVAALRAALKVSLPNHLAHGLLEALLATVICLSATGGRPGANGPWLDR